MFGIGVMEIIILLGIVLLGIAFFAAISFVVRAAVRSGNRDSLERK